MLAGNELETKFRHRPTEALAVLAHALAQLRPFFAPEQPQHLERRRRDRRCERVGEEVRARALAQKLYDGLPPRRVTAGRAAQGLAERSGHYVDARGDTTVFRGAAPTLADEADRVGIV